MEASERTRRTRFGAFELDLDSGALHKRGIRLKLQDQPFQVLALLLEHPGQVVTREQLRLKLWPADTFVDFDNGLNSAVNKLRDVLKDSADEPRYIETLTRRGYRFIAPVENAGDVDQRGFLASIFPGKSMRRLLLFFAAFTLLLVVGLFFYRSNHKSNRASLAAQRSLTRITFDQGLQIGATWSPDGRFIAYASDRGGKFDIWVQQVTGGAPVQVTKGPGQNWQPDWSPDGKSIVYRSEGGGGLFLIPALGGEGLERRISSFGYHPRWSPDGSHILFRTHLAILDDPDRFYVIDTQGGQPRGVLANLTLPTESQYRFDSASWHPDGKRLSILLWGLAPSPRFWTVPLSGGLPVKSDVSPQVAKQFAEASATGTSEFARDAKVSWAPSGDAIYFDRINRGARNLWRMNVDPSTLRGVAAERLTVGAGYDVQPALSPDGKRLAFTSETRHVRTWLFPFDADRGRLNGSGEAVTSPGLESWSPDLSRDGARIAFSAIRGHREELWEMSLADGHEIPIFTDEYLRGGPQWSPDGTHLAYRRFTFSGREGQVCVWSTQTHNEVAVTPPNSLEQLAFDWFPDGRSLLLTVESSDTHRREVWQQPIPTAGSAATPTARKLISDPDHRIYQEHLSPDGKWIVYEGFKESAPVESNIYVTPTAGGPLTRILEGNNWNDKPRWSPDGKTIYYISDRNGVFNVWGIHFDSTHGKPVGTPFMLTSFKNTGPEVADNISEVEFSLVRDKFVLTMEDHSGGIWVLDNVDR